MDQHLSDFQDWTDALPHDIQSELEVFVPPRTRQNFMIRIDVETPPVFTPRMPKSAVEGEDYSVPRVCVSANLMEAVLGYARLADEYQDGVIKYQISAFQYTIAVQPSEKLLPHVKKTNEYWLVNYNKDTAEYKPIMVGSMVVVKYTEELIVRLKRKVSTVVLLVEIDHDSKIPLVPRDLAAKAGHTDIGFFSRGHYRVTMEKDNNVSVRVDSIDKAEFDEILDTFSVATENARNTAGMGILERW